MIFVKIDGKLQPLDQQAMFPHIKNKKELENAVIEVLEEEDAEWIKSYSLTAALRKYDKARRTD